MKKLIFLWICCAVLFGCVDTKKKAPLEGRIALYDSASELEPNTKTVVQLEKPQPIKDWLQPNANAQNNRPTVLMGESLKKFCELSVAPSYQMSGWALSEPLVKDGIIYTLDANFSLSATQLSTCKKIWTKPLPVNQNATVKAIGLTLAKNTLFAVSGDGVLYAVDLKGTILGKKEFNISVRSTPIVYRDKLYITASSNEIFVLNVLDGTDAWKYKTFRSPISFFGMAPVAVYNDYLIAPFTNGDITAFDTQTGTTIWEENFLTSNVYNKISDLSHILASPVIDENTVYIVSNANQVGAFNIATGRKLWSISLSGSTTPTLSGNTLFVISNEGNIIALDKKTGKVIWNEILVSKSEQNAVWKGPVVIGKNLAITSSRGDLVILEAKTGEQKQRFDIAPVLSAPIAVENKLILLTNKSHLIIYQ